TPAIKNKLYEFWINERKKTNQFNSGLKAAISLNVLNYSKSLEELCQVNFNPQNSIYNDIYNSSSISFLLKCPDLSILLLADSRPEVISQTMQNFGYCKTTPLDVDLVKISHHGSLNNTSQEMLSLIRSN